MPNGNDDRMRRMEERLAALERHLGMHSESMDATPSSKPTPTPLPGADQSITAHRAAEVKPVSPRRRTPSADALPITALLGWGGVAALVLAAVYLVQLAIDAGFLTPVRQVALAGIFGVGLIITGLILRQDYKKISALLPAGGVAVLFVMVYGAHLYHNLVGPIPAAVGIILICLTSLGLRTLFQKEYFAFFAVIGAYSGPFFLHILAARPVDLIVYFGAWNLLFCIFALRSQRRSIYLLAAYLAFVVFDATWRQAEYSDWAWAAGFQAAQFLIFLCATVLYSIRSKRPLSDIEALVHFPPLLFFYATVYPLLDQHIASSAPWLAFASAIPMVIGYVVTRMQLPREARAGELIVSMYAAIVLFHAGYMELVPHGYGELTSWLTLVAIGGIALARVNWLRRFWPLTVAATLTALIGYTRLASGLDLQAVFAWEFLIVLFAASGYVGYWLSKRSNPRSIVSTVLLYAAHLMVMAGVVHLTDSRLTVSVVWGVLAVGTLLSSIVFEDRRLGRSALLLFVAFAAKVMLFDLSGAAPLVRIGSLVVLGVTMYLGSMLYQNIDDNPGKEAAGK